MTNSFGEMRIDIMEAGPYLVSGNIPLVRVKIVTDSHGDSVGFEETYRYPASERYSLCRCGQSRVKPFCDGTHASTGFRGQEVAPHTHFHDEAELTSGDGIHLYDAPRLCVGARFCDRAGGVWSLTEKSHVAQFKDIAIEEARLCPSGRLVMVDELTNQPDEIEYEPSIALIEDPTGGASGAIWVRGRIPVYDSNGALYEVRNRVTLCRCGHSRDMPFCDGSHYTVHFDDGHVAD